MLARADPARCIANIQGDGDKCPWPPQPRFSSFCPTFPPARLVVKCTRPRPDRSEPGAEGAARSIRHDGSSTVAPWHHAVHAWSKARQEAGSSRPRRARSRLPGGRGRRADLPPVVASPPQGRGGQSSARFRRGGRHGRYRHGAFLNVGICEGSCRPSACATAWRRPRPHAGSLQRVRCTQREACRSQGMLGRHRRHRSLSLDPYADGLARAAKVVNPR
jgi:hypothetical protein